MCAEPTLGSRLKGGAVLYNMEEFPSVPSPPAAKHQPKPENPQAAQYQQPKKPQAYTKTLSPYGPPPRQKIPYSIGYTSTNCPNHPSHPTQCG